MNKITKNLDKLLWLPDSMSFLITTYFKLAKIKSTIICRNYIKYSLVFQLVTPRLLQILDKRMSHQLSFRYAILKGYVQGEADIMTIIDKIASSKQVKQVRKTLNTKKMVYFPHSSVALTHHVLFLHM